MIVDVRGVEKRFGAEHALGPIDLEFAPGTALRGIAVSFCTRDAAGFTEAHLADSLLGGRIEQVGHFLPVRGDELAVDVDRVDGAHGAPPLGW